jgi:hypothetical protein
VNLCFLAGLAQPEAAKQMSVSISTVERKRAFARAWLFREMRRNQGGKPAGKQLRGLSDGRRIYRGERAPPTYEPTIRII